MKKQILAFILFLSSSSAFAGDMGEISWMAIEAALVELKQDYPSVEVLNQSFTEAEPAASLATKTVFAVQGESQKWTCVSQFVKTPEFFKVSKTECYQ